MPNTFLDARDRWLDLSEIDYLGQFVRAWLALNAWYRSAYAETQDRVIIDKIKAEANPIRSKIVPMLSNAANDGAELRATIGALHERLENYHIEVGKGADKKPITFRDVYLRPRAVTAQVESYSSWQYEVRPGVQSGSIVCTVTDRRQMVKLSVSHQKFDLPTLEQDPQFVALSQNQQGMLRGLYGNMSPRLVADITSRRENGWKTFDIGAVQFECPPDDLYAAIVEVVYQMRCTLFHGELVPTKEATACYEPAYKIVRRMLTSIT